MFVLPRNKKTMCLFDRILTKIGSVEGISNKVLSLSNSLSFYMSWWLIIQYGIRTGDRSGVQPHCLPNVKLNIYVRVFSPFMKV